ncbi:hypothetical protein BE20_07890 [Sorangium cellulosum]|nr:hypothetical protein BE20_07890 [Sorangium cellulosum]
MLETFCATIPGESTGLVPRDLERLLRSDLPITPVLARQLEAFTGTPARYLWRLHDDDRTDAEETLLIQLGEPAIKRENAARAPAAPAPTSERPGPAAVPERAPDVPPPVVAIPDLPRAKLPPPPQSRLRSPLPSRPSPSGVLPR